MPTLTIRTNAKKVSKNLRYLRTHSPEAQEETLRETAEIIREKMTEPGDPSPEHPNWATPLQQTAFHASGGFGGGDPTIRTDHYIEGWHVKDVKGGSQVYNNTKGAKYIGGNAYGGEQSTLHQGRWNLFRDVYDLQVRKLPKNLVRNLQATVARINPE